MRKQTREGLLAMRAQARRLLYAPKKTQNAHECLRLASKKIQEVERIAERLGIHLGQPSKHWKARQASYRRKDLGDLLAASDLGAFLEDRGPGKRNKKHRRSYGDFEGGAGYAGERP